MNPTDAGANGVPALEDSTGALRKLACLPSRRTLGASFGQAKSLINRSDWQEVDLRFLGAPVLNQGQSNSCVGHATCSAFTVAWLLSGAPDQIFSPSFVYGNIKIPPDSGASLGDALTFMEKTGICLEDQAHEGMFDPPYPRTAYDTAKKFRIEAAIPCRNFDEIGSALQLNFAVPFAIFADNTFMHVGGDGKLPDRPGAVGQVNHAVCAVGLKFFNNRPYLIVQNSYSKSWGDKGFCYMPESYIESQSDSWALQAATDEPLDGTN